MNKIVTILVAAMFSWISVTFSQTSLTLSPTTLDGNPGEMVTLQVTANDFTDIVSMQFGVKWDPAVLQYNSVDNFNLKDLTAGNFNADVAAGFLSFSWFESSTLGTSVADGESIFTISFAVLGAAGSGTAITFESRPGLQIELANSTGEITSSVVLTNSQFGDPNANNDGSNSPIAKSISSGSGQSGTTICVDMEVSDFMDITEMQYTLNWDAAVLDFSEVKNFNLAGLTQSSFATNNTANGQLVLDWSSNSGVTLSNGTSIYQLCFNLIGSAGSSSSVSISDTPGPVVNTSTSTSSIGISQSSGTITISDDANPPQSSGDNLVNLPALNQDPGTSVCIPVTVNDFTGIASLQFSLQWDPAVLQFSEVTGFNLPDLSVGNFNTDQAANGRMAIAWFDNTAQGINLQDGDAIFEICFTVVGADGTSSNLVFSDTPTSREAATANNTIDFTETNGSVTVGSGSPPPPPSAADKLVNIENTNASPGSTLCVPVTVSDFNGIASLQFSLQWDPAVLSFTEVSNFNLPDLSAANFNTTMATSGKAAMAWFDNTAQGVTLQDGATLFELCFTVLGAEGTSSTIAFTDDPTAKEAATATNTITFTETNGLVTVGSGPPPPPGDDGILNIGDITATSGSSICVPVTVSDFDAIAAMQFSLDWDPAVLTFTGTQNFGLPDLAASSFNTSGTDNGNISVAWFDQAAQGITLADGETVFEICFTVAGADGTSSGIRFTDSPTSRELATATGTLEFSSSDGTFTVGDGPPPPPDGNLDSLVNIAPITVMSGESFCAPIVVNNFNDIASIQFSLGWDPSVIEFTGVQTFGLPDLSAASFNTGSATNGAVSIAWFDNTAQGITLNRGATLFEVCFVAIGDNGTSTILAFTDTPTFREASTANNTVPFTQNNGLVTIGTVECTEFSASLLAADITCNGLSDGTITVSPSGGSGTYTYQWSEASIGNVPNPTGLSAGSYTVTVSSCSGQVSEVLSVDIAEPAAMIAVVTPQDANCFGVADGVINISLAGGTQPYTYTWSDPTLAPASRPVNALAGTYSLTITDNNGCEDITQNIVISSPTEILVTATTTNSPCSGSPDGTASLSASGGSGGGYSYDWGVDGVVGANPTNVPSGTYMVTVTDSDNCSSVAEVTVGADIVISGSAQIVEDACGDGSGAVSITPDGGTGPYSYSWSGPVAIGNTNMAENIPTGTYEVIITDANGCFSTEIIEVGGPIAILSATADVQDVDCPGDNNGSISLNASGGFGPYTYAWSNGATTENIDDLSSGEYSVVITDSKACTVETSFTVGTQSNMSFDFTVNNGVPDASITVAVSGGVGPYTYEWCNGQDTPTATGLDEGNCSLTVIDDLGCVLVENVEVGVDNPVAQIMISNPVSCNGESDGVLMAQITGGKAPYTYAWNTGANNNIIVNVGAGNYDLTVTDANGNTDMISYTFEEPDPISISANRLLPSCESGGEIEVSITGGTPPYKSIAWSNGINDVLGLEGLREGEYGVIVTDQNDCTAEENFRVISDPGCKECYTSLKVMTPNADGRNDAFFINCTDLTTNNRLEVYNRWGQLVFEAEDYRCVLGTETDCWRGRNRSEQLVDEGGYFWVLEFDDAGGRRRIRDHVTIMYDE